MFTPWNPFSACLLAKNDRIGRARLDLVNQGHVIPLGREVHRQSGGFTPPVVAKRTSRYRGPARLGSRNDHISVECLNLVHQGGVIPLGLSSEFRIPSSEFGSAPCSMHHACPSTGVQSFFKQVSHKAPSTQKEGGIFPLIFCLLHGLYAEGIVCQERQNRRLINDGATH